MRASLKALLHEAMFPATCSATNDDRMARQVAEYTLQLIWQRCEKQQPSLLSLQLTTEFSVARHVAKRGVTRAISSPTCVATPGTVLQVASKIAPCNGALLHDNVKTLFTILYVLPSCMASVLTRTVYIESCKAL